MDADLHASAGHGRTRRLIAAALIVVAPIAGGGPLTGSSARAADFATKADEAFWGMVTGFSEPDGAFQQELMSNEDSAQVVIPALTAATRPGGVYIGVGPEQNFTYIAAIQPQLAFILDIRRENMLQHLLYKALFELSNDRTEFLSRLFSRKRPSGVDPRSSAADLFTAFAPLEPDVRAYDESLQAAINLLTRDHGFALTATDKSAIAGMLRTFQTAGPLNLKGSGDKNLTYVEAMTGTDLTGAAQSYLTSEERFTLVRDMERANAIVPVVGDFAGDKALVSIGRYLKEQNLIVKVFYVSNVERYLFQQGDHGRRFYTNVASLPLDRSSMFIRSVTRDISVRLGIRLPDAARNWWTFLTPIQSSLDGIMSGRIETYAQLFEVAR